MLCVCLRQYVITLQSHSKHLKLSLEGRYSVLQLVSCISCHAAPQGKLGSWSHSLPIVCPVQAMLVSVCSASVHRAVTPHMQASSADRWQWTHSLWAQGCAMSPSGVDFSFSVAGNHDGVACLVSFSCSCRLSCCLYGNHCGVGCLVDFPFL